MCIRDRYDRTAEAYQSLGAMLDGSAAAEAVAALRAKIEARDAANSNEVDAAADPAPVKKGKLSAEEQAAEDAAIAREADKAASLEAAAKKQAEADEAALAAANVSWLERIEERALPLEWTPLMYAAARGSDENVRLLIEAGADVNVKDIHGLTPLHKASGAKRGAVKIEVRAAPTVLGTRHTHAQSRTVTHSHAQSPDCAMHARARVARAPPPRVRPHHVCAPVACATPTDPTS